MFFDTAITLLLVFLNGFFVAAEFAIVKVRSSQLELSAKSGNRLVKLSRHITSHLDGYLAATQLGITLASLGLGWIGEPVVSQIILKLMHVLNVEINPELAHNVALPVAFAFITVLHIVFGELAPKSIAIQHSKKTTLMIAYPLQVFYIIFRPFIWVLNGISNVMLKILGISSVQGTEVHSSEELKYLVKQRKDSGMIEASDYAIIKNAFDFSARTAKQIMVPRTQVLAIDVNNFTEVILEKVIDESYSRIPCYEDSLDKIVGVVYLKDILMKLRKNQPISIREIMRPVIFAPETKRIGQLLKDFQQKHQQIAIVVDEFGNTNGIVTMEDILEELVGEIQDEYDMETSLVQKMGDNSYSVAASISINQLNELLSSPIQKSEAYETLAGFLISKFGRIPNTNDKIVSDNYEFTILKKSRNTISLVQIRDLSNASKIYAKASSK